MSIRVASCLLLPSLLLLASGCNSGSRSAPGTAAAGGGTSAVASGALAGTTASAIAAEAVPADPGLLAGTSDLYSAATHRDLSAVAAANGAPALEGRVLTTTGAPNTGVFEVRLEPRSGGEPLRVLFSDGSGGFQVWPAPGDYDLLVHTDSGWSASQAIRVEPGQALAPVDVTVD